jgi:hypothetical protein
MSTLAVELLVSTFLVSLTVAVHLLGLEALLLLAGLHLKFLKTAWLRVDRLLVPLGMALGLFALHGLEIWIYAVAYRLIEALPNVEEALFFSSSAYSTLGASGAALPKPWRIVGVLESVNGMLLIGWSTAFLFATLHWIMEPDSAHPLPEGAIAPDHPAPEDSNSLSPRPKGSGNASPVGTN